MSVWPVLKSLPAIGTPCASANWTMHGRSTLRLGAPLANGTPELSAAKAYSWLGEMLGSSAFMPASNASMVSWTAVNRSAPPIGLSLR